VRPAARTSRGAVGYGGDPPGMTIG
jgi:hypothetical protein